MTEVELDSALRSPPAGSSRRWRLGFVNTHPIQYFAPLYAYLTQTSRFDVTAFYLSDYSLRGGTDRAFGRAVKWDLDLLSGYRPKFVPGAERRNEPKSFLSMLAPQVWHEVREQQLDALVIHGHTPAAVLLAAAAAKTRGIPVFARGETHLELSRSLMKRAVRQVAMGAFYRQFAGVLAIGSANARFYRAVGVPERKIFPVPYTVDNDRFCKRAELSDAERREVRAEIGVSDDLPAILYAAKLQSRKRPDDLLRAAAVLNSRGLRFHLVVAGSGHMESELRRLVRELRLGNVHFPGFVNQSSLPALYAAMDLFVLPSENEPWGLAVNEAMCAGLPIVVSDAVGCAQDLVHLHRNGMTFPARNIEKLAEALEPILADKSLRQRMGKASRAIIAKWSFAECAAGLEQAMRSVEAAA